MHFVFTKNTKLLFKILIKPLNNELHTVNKSNDTQQSWEVAAEESARSRTTHHYCDTDLSDFLETRWKGSM